MWLCLNLKNLRTSHQYALFKPCWLRVTTIVIHFSFFQVSLCSQNLGGCKKITVNGRIQQTTTLSKGKITTEFHIYDNQQITVYWWYPTANYCQTSWLSTRDNFPMSSRVNYRIQQNKTLERTVLCSCIWLLMEWNNTMSVLKYNKLLHKSNTCS